MIAKSVKSADFDVDFADFMVFVDFYVVFADFDVDFVDFAADFVDFTDFGLKLVKLTISFHCTVRIQWGNINFFLKICRIRKICKIHIEICGFPHLSLNRQEDI